MCLLNKEITYLVVQNESSEGFKRGRPLIPEGSAENDGLLGENDLNLFKMASKTRVGAEKPIVGGERL